MIGSTVTVAAVKNELGESESNISFLCTSSKINMWAKYKPFDSSKITLNDVDRASSNYGLSIPIIDNLNNASSYNWDYKKPKGGKDSPYRLGDFRNYSNIAGETIRSGITNGSTVSIEYSNNEYRFNFALYNINGINGGIGLSDLHYNNIPFNDIRLGIIGKDKYNNWYYSIAPTADSSYIPISAKAIENRYPINCTLCLLTSDFKPPIYGTDTIPEQGSAYPIYHNNNIGYGNSVKLVVKDKPSFSFTLSKISTSLQGTYENWEKFIVGGSTFTSYFGNIYFKFTNIGFPAQININDIKFYSSSNFHTNTSFNATVADGTLKIYNSSFAQLSPGSTLTLSSNDTFYIGGDYLLNLGFTDVPLYKNIQSTFIFSTEDSSNSYGTFNLQGY